jgi:hypothetical protein
MFQVTVVSANGTQLPIAWFTDYAEMEAFVNQIRSTWTSILVHEVRSVKLTTYLVPRDRFEVT